MGGYKWHSRKQGLGVKRVVRTELPRLASIEYGEGTRDESGGGERCLYRGQREGKEGSTGRSSGLDVKSGISCTEGRNVKCMSRRRKPEATGGG